MPSQPGTSLFDATPFDLVPIHIFVVESSGAIRYANEAFARYTGSSDARLSPLELTHEADVEAVLAAWRSGRATRQTYQVECRFRRHDGHYRWNEWQVGPLEYAADGAVSAWVAACVEIHHERDLEADLERARDRAELLDRANLRMTAATTLGEAIDAAAWSGVPAFADIVVVDLLRAERAERIAIAMADLGLPNLEDRLRRYAPEAGEKGDPGYTMIASGQPLFMPGLDIAAVSEDLVDEEHARLFHETAPRSAILAPLTVEGSTFGAMTFLRRRRREPFDDEDFEAGLELARRAALHLDRARALAELQSALAVKDELPRHGFPRGPHPGHHAHRGLEHPPPSHERPLPIRPR